MFKKGDEVILDGEISERGIVVEAHEYKPNCWWVDWTMGEDAGLKLWVPECDLTLLSEATKKTSNFRVSALKKLLDKMDDDLVISFSDLSIHFGNMEKDGG